MVAEQLKLKVNVDHREPTRGLTMLHIAAGSGYVDSVQLLLSSGAQWRETSGERCEVPMLEHLPETVRLLVDWLCAPSAVSKREAAAALLATGQLVVDCARLSSFLSIEPLLEAAVRTLSSALVDFAKISRRTQSSATFVADKYDWSDEAMQRQAEALRQQRPGGGP